VEKPELTLILSGDHITRWITSTCWHGHRRNQADITMATIQVPPEQAVQFGVANIDSDYRITGLKKSRGTTKPRVPRSTIHGSASMGVYMINTSSSCAA